MKHASFCWLALILCCGNLLQAESFQLGTSRLEIPPPAGFVNVTPEIRELFPFDQMMAETKRQGMDVYFYLTEALAAQLRQGEPVEPARYLILQIPEKSRQRSYSASDFAMFKLTTKERNQEYRDMLAEKLKQTRDNLSRDLSRELDLNVAFQISNTVALEPHYESINELSSSKYVSYGVQIEGADEVQDANVNTLTFLNVKRKLIALGAIAPYKDLEWTRTTSRAWAKAILSQNPEPSPFPDRLPDNSRENLIPIATLVTLAMMAVLAIIVKRRRKQVASSEDKNETVA
ncbi:hypothetical protein [Gimesia chilikensis]|uniref:Uncharacterized protein n=1 Tax=Gimesia chilikensis TaxID=2605989 RepID=A0A517PZ58_9PLAN|nr:hypothetical protein [Gimesia chilikensis]QDT24663.1 hypothetical protein HG66A1_64980 [Gimesia chilikensis]